MLSAFWQSSGGAYRAVVVLQRQPGLWGLLAGLLDGAATAPPIAPPVLTSGETRRPGDEAAEAAAVAAWVGLEGETALVLAEACALQILAVECHTWAGAAGGPASSSGGMPTEVAALLRRLPGGLVPPLLRRYSLPLPTAQLLLAAQQAAAAAGLQLLGAAMLDDTVWRSMAVGAALPPLLASAAQPLLARFGGDQALAAQELSADAAAVAAVEFRTQPATVAVARLVLRQGEVPARVAGDCPLGRGFVFDSMQFKRRLGSGLMQQLDELSRLPSTRMFV